MKITEWIRNAEYVYFGREYNLARPGEPSKMLTTGALLYAYTFVTDGRYGNMAVMYNPPNRFPIIAPMPYGEHWTVSIDAETFDGKYLLEHIRPATHGQGMLEASMLMRTFSTTYKILPEGVVPGDRLVWDAEKKGFMLEVRS